MEDLKNVLKESLEYYQEQEKIIISRLSLSPKGRFKKKKIGKDIYYYLQYRKGKKIIDEYIGKKIPKDLEDQLKQRKKLEAELKKVREALRLLNQKHSTETDFSSPLNQILSKMTEYNLWDSGIEIVGSWCFLIYQKYLPIEKYPMRTQDLDILIPFPYKGKAFDFSSFFRELGFEERFNPDGSFFFSASSLKIEFIAPKGSSKQKGTKHIKELSVNPQFLQFVNMLLTDTIVIRISQNLKVKLPAPHSFFLHKLLISTRSLRKEKKKKDLMQAIHIGKFILRNPKEKEKLNHQWDSLSKSWRKKIQQSLHTAHEHIPIEESTINQLGKILK